jgi:uncharacterized integral membrane protein
VQSVIRTLFGIIAAVLALGLVVFGVQNTQLVEIRFLGFSTGRLSLSLVVIVAAIVGAAIIWLVGLWSAAQRSIRQLREGRQRTAVEARNKELEKKLAQLEAELAQLKAPAPAAEPAAPNNAGA